MNILFDRLYRFVLYPILSALLRLAAIGNAKIREGLFLRRPDQNGQVPWLQGPAGSRPIWIHCASGEFEYAKPVISEIKRRDPEQKILLTYFSPSARIPVSRFPGVDLHSPSPWDRRKDVVALIRHHRPRALLIARTDTWPAMLQAARAEGVPSLLFSATLTEAAGRMKPLARSLSRWVFGQLTSIYCVSAEDRERFTELVPQDHVTVAGDTRFDQVIARLDAPKPIKDLFAHGRPEAVLTAGSTWSEDEARLIPVLRALRGRLKGVIAPHEPTTAHLEELEDRLRTAGLRFARYSAVETWPNDTDVVLVDQVGILAELYTLAEFAFVGGSFRKTVHSVMEPLAAGCLTFLGPLHHNNREALEFKTLVIPDSAPFSSDDISSEHPSSPHLSNQPPNPLTCVIEVMDENEWEKKLRRILDADLSAMNPQRAKEETRNKASEQRRESIRAEVRARSGRSRLVADWVFAQRLSPASSGTSSKSIQESNH